jgi:hypothetical protein
MNQLSENLFLARIFGFWSNRFSPNSLPFS